MVALPTPAPQARVASAPALPPPPPDFSHAEIEAARRISAEETVDLIDAGAALLVDVRDVESYRAGHIPGALQIPLGFVEGELQYFPRDKKLIFYCT
jgi:3-mercaptopyruvate sulfurtransferase SseA